MNKQDSPGSAIAVAQVSASNAQCAKGHIVIPAKAGIAVPQSPEQMGATASHADA